MAHIWFPLDDAHDGLWKQGQYQQLAASGFFNFWLGNSDKRVCIILCELQAQEEKSYTFSIFELVSMFRAFVLFFNNYWDILYQVINCFQHLWQLQKTRMIKNKVQRTKGQYQKFWNLPLWLFLLFWYSQSLLLSCFCRMYILKNHKHKGWPYLSWWYFGEILRRLWI